jgi:hypothetical protein
VSNLVETICWFDHEGGPLILLPRETLPFWEGSDPPSGGRVVEAVSRWDNQKEATDYDRAGDVMAWAEVLTVGENSWGMVLPEDAGGIALLTLEENLNTFAIIQSHLFDTDTLLGYRSAFAEAVQDSENWTTLHDNLLILEGDLLLMHTASRGDEIREVAWNRAAQIGNGQVLRAPVGSYSLDQYLVSESDENAAGPIFTRFQRIR